MGRIESARPDENEAFRTAPSATLEAFLRQSVDGFNAGPSVTSVFVVRGPEARWVIENLPPSMNESVERLPAGARITTTTAGVDVLARFVAGLGDCARAETPELRSEVLRIAKGTLRGHVEGPVRAGLNSQAVSTIQPTRYGRRAR